MPKLFISYRRKSWPFTYPLADELGKRISAEIFIDYKDIDETDFEASILRNLRESDAVLLIVSEETFDRERIRLDTDWVRREIREALALDKPIVLALVNEQTPPADLPDDICKITTKQGIPFHSVYYDAAVEKLADFLDKATPIKRKKSLLKRFLAWLKWLIHRLKWWIIALVTMIIAAMFIIGVLSILPKMSEQARFRAAEKGVTRNADWVPYTKNIDGVEMALVPEGCFQMGSDSGDADEKPIHNVCFDKPFWLDVYEVTQAQFGELGGEAVQASHFVGDTLPREQITWTEAAAFCQKRNSRLPTEAEWEYASRGPDGLIYPWGDDFIADNTVYSDNSGGHTWNVGSKSGGISWIGAYDLSGNVWEWVSDWYSDVYYSTLVEGVVNPEGPESGESRVLRGGSWFYLDASMSGKDRDKDDPEHGRSSSGFRCAADFPVQS